MNAPPNRGGPAPVRDELAGYFSEHGPAPAPSHELIDSDAATRVADAATSVQGGDPYAAPPGGVAHHPPGGAPGGGGRGGW